MKIINPEIQKAGSQLPYMYVIVAYHTITKQWIESEPLELDIAQRLLQQILEKGE